MGGICGHAQLVDISSELTGVIFQPEASVKISPIVAGLCLVVIMFTSLSSVALIVQMNPVRVAATAHNPPWPAGQVTTGPMTGGQSEAADRGAIAPALRARRGSPVHGG